MCLQVLLKQKDDIENGQRSCQIKSNNEVTLIQGEGFITSISLNQSIENDTKSADLLIRWKTRELTEIRTGLGWSI